MKNTIKVINELKYYRVIEDYAIGGAIGVLKWVEPFFTRDLDVFIILPQKEKDKHETIISLSPLYDYLQQKGYKEWIGQWIIIEGLPVEFIPAEGLAIEAVESAVEIEFEEIKTKVMTPEYLIPLLSQAGRDKDIIKIRMLLDEAKVDMEKMQAILIKYGLKNKYNSLLRVGNE